MFLSWWLGVVRVIGVERLIARQDKAEEFIDDINRLQIAAADLGKAYYNAIASADAVPWQLPDETAFETVVRNFQARHGAYVTRKIGEGEEARFEMPLRLIRQDAPAGATAAVLPPKVSGGG